MGRIRTIKPEFPQSETIGRVSRDARLLFIQLWTIVDDDGRTRAASRMLASLLYPYDDDAPSLIDGWLDELEAEQCIRRYVVDGTTYLDIPKWLDHQRVDKARPSRLPAFDEKFAKPRDNSRSLATDLGPRTVDLGMDHGPRTMDPPTREVARSAPAWPFEDFWIQFPNKVGKQDALKAFRKVERGGSTSFETLMAGLLRYAAKTDDRPWCNPATWLNQGRWEDQPAAPPNGGLHETAGNRARRFAEQAHERERAAGIGRSDDALGSARGGGPDDRLLSPPGPIIPH